MDRILAPALLGARDNTELPELISRLPIVRVSWLIFAFRYLRTGGLGRGSKVKSLRLFSSGIFAMLSASAVYPEEFELLRPEEFASLRELVMAPGRSKIPRAHISRLRALGLVCMQLEIPCITPLGISRIAIGM